jgi:hypothetical protein
MSPSPPAPRTRQPSVAFVATKDDLTSEVTEAHRGFSPCSPWSLFAAHKAACLAGEVRPRELADCTRVVILDPSWGDSEVKARR